MSPLRTLANPCFGIIQDSSFFCNSNQLNKEPFAKLKAALYEVPVPKDGSISTNPIAKAIGEDISSHYLVPPRV